MGLRDAPDLARDLGDMTEHPGQLADIEVLTDQVHEAGGPGQHAFAPGPDRADADDLYRRVRRLHDLGEAVVLLDVILKRHMAELPVAVHLVAHRPPLHSPGTVPPVFGAPSAHQGGGCAVDVFDLFGGHGLRALAAVDRDVRLGIDEAAQVQELVDADVVVLDPEPGRVLARRAAVGITDAVLPVVAADEIAARPAIYRRIQLLEQGQDIGTEALDVVCRHQ